MAQNDNKSYFNYMRDCGCSGQFHSCGYGYNQTPKGYLDLLTLDL